MRVYVPGFAGSEGMIARHLFCGTHTQARGAVWGNGGEQGGVECSISDAAADDDVFFTGLRAG